MRAILEKAKLTWYADVDIVNVKVDSSLFQKTVSLHQNQTITRY